MSNIKAIDDIACSTTGTRAKRIAMYVIYDKDGILDGFRKYYLQEIRKVTDYIVAVVSGTLTPESRTQLEALTDDFFVRENKGLLAYSWIEGIEHIGWDKLSQYDELLMLNDSFFGPFFPLEDMFSQMEQSNADFYGALQNFEEKAYTQIAGRALKHGHFRGSIAYFYVIRNRLLHSPEFKKYWSKKPIIHEDWDTYFFNEIDFYDYVIDAGFCVDAYQSDALKRYFFNNLTHNVSKLISKDKSPFARIRPFCTDLKDQSLQIHYGKDPREAIAYIDKNTNYDVNLIWDYILRTKNLTDIYNQLQLQYVLPRNSTEKPFEYTKKIAVILYIEYDDLVEEIATYCENFITNTDFYITTPSEKAEALINRAFSKRKLHYSCLRRPDLGFAMSALWVTYADIVTSSKYEYFCYFHDKKSPDTQYEIYTEQFATRYMENLFGTREVVENTINLFEDNPRLGVLGVPAVYHGDYFCISSRNWRDNYQNTVELAKKLNLKVDINIDTIPVAPYGDMFWFRADALKKVIGQGLTYDDFDAKHSSDFTFIHAIERIYGFAAQDSGYYYGEVLNSDNARSDLINYQYMLYEMCKIMLKNGYQPHSFEAVKAILRQDEANALRNMLEGANAQVAYLMSQLSLRSALKRFMKRRLPKFIYLPLRSIKRFFFGPHSKAGLEG